MPAVHSLNDQSEPRWEDVVVSLDEVKAHPGDRCVSLRVDDDHSLIVYYTDEGFLVTGLGVGDPDYYVLIDPALGDRHVNVWCAGNDMDRPQKVFVGEALALQAMKHFFETGKRDPALTWGLDSKCW
jgi:hypothetical protein